jgi:general stress protein 26
MKNIIVIFFLFFISCSPSPQKTNIEIRSDFNRDEKAILSVSREIIKGAYFADFVSIDKKGMPKIRVIEPFFPDPQWQIFFGTNPKSRKVKEINNNPKTALHYFDKSRLAYVSLYGKAFIETDSLLRKKYWKESWKKFYPDKEKDYLLIRFIPQKLEMIHLTKGYTGDSVTWGPHIVILRD